MMELLEKVLLLENRIQNTSMNIEIILLQYRYHQKFKMTIGSSTLRISGSPESHNTYAQEYFNSMSTPCQDLLYVHPKNGITSEYTIWLDAV